MVSPAGATRRFALQDNQRHAVDPKESVWLSASAGTGKTQVLSSRVLRLLLQPGVEPSQILCLTFTRAGAAEMANRVNDELTSWVRADEAVLTNSLRAIGAPFDPDTRARARTRFASVLDCPGGGLRIETIHAFSQWLLSAFPMEAGLIPGTRPMEDRDRELLLRQVLSQMLIEAEETGNTTLTQALAMLSLRMDQSAIENFLMACAAAREVWEGPGAWQPPLMTRVRRLLGLAAEAQPDELAASCSDDLFAVDALRSCMAALQSWGTKTGLGHASAIAAWLERNPIERLATLPQLRSALFTKAGAVRSLKFVLKIDPAYEEHAAEVKELLQAVEDAQALEALASWLSPALTLGRSFALAWEEAKNREGFIDFDDQIRQAARLLQRSDMSDWIRYKLDRRFDHILVDEAQDTNAAQWNIINALTEEFYAGIGAAGERPRTLFVVGDYKQAIFRFQGTSPENFEAARQRVRGRMAQAFANKERLRGEHTLRTLKEYGLERSYRTAQPILDFVDDAIAAIGPQNFGLTADPGRHLGEERPGQVVLWRAVGAAADAQDGEGGLASTAEETGGSDRLGEEQWLSRPDRCVADNIARQVRHWLDSGFMLVKGQARHAGPGDILILVRKRKDLAGLIVARLHAQGVPVAGVDRLRLGAPLVVRDLMAALRFAAQPHDDLSLAALLVSPLFGWSQADLLEHGYREKHVRLWDHLRAATAQTPRDAVTRLLALLARADYQPLQALLHWLLVGPWQGRRVLMARLGAEAGDAIDELLNAALAFAAVQTASLAGFVRWFDAGSGELKREAAQDAGLVRVMTVHGSKGLQAPIVILADAADDPDRSMPSGMELTEAGDPAMGFAPRCVPLPPLRKEERRGRIVEAQQAAAIAERQEHWRLLYVAMTRAEEALFIAGALPARRDAPPEDSWYARLSDLFSGDWQDDPIWAGALTAGQEACHSVSMMPTVAPAARVTLPEWLHQPVGQEPRPPRPLAPSTLDDYAAPDPPLRPHPDMAAPIDPARRGVLIHRLLERLPVVAPADRLAAASRWLSKQAADLTPDDRQTLISAAMKVLDDPAFAAIFSADALAEVPLTATFDGRVITGTVDRLLIGRNLVQVVDYKTTRSPPTALGEIPLAHLRQMAAYVTALQIIYPARTVEAGLLYTQAPRLFTLPASLLHDVEPTAL
ncbi:double-strand break repair helicase AddA [Croceicoccus esteveae]